MIQLLNGQKKLKRKPNRAKRRGLTLIETAGAITIMALILGGFALIVGQETERLRARNAAERLREVTKASEQYVKAYSQALFTATNGGTRVLIPVGRATATDPVPAGPNANLPSVQGAGFLLSTYVDRNTYRQGHALIIRQVPISPTNQRLEAMVVTTGGIPIPDNYLGSAAKLLGSQGGMMLTTPPPSTGNNVVGVNGGWSAAPGTWSAGGVAPTPGRMVASFSPADVDVGGQYLMRVQSTNPDNNTMSTNLSMGDKNITNANTIIGNDGVSNIVFNANELTIGPNISVSGYVRAGGNITSEATVQGQNLVATSTATVGGQLTAGAITSNSNVTAATFIDKNNPTYYMTPSTNTHINKALIDELSLDTNVSGLLGNVSPGNNGTGLTKVRLGDLLPRWSFRAAYIANLTVETEVGGLYTYQDAEIIPYPNCGAGQPQIILSHHKDSYDTTIPALQMDANNYQILTNVSMFGRSPFGNYVAFPGTYSVPILNDPSKGYTTQEIQYELVRTLYAKKEGAGWRVVMEGSQAGRNNPVFSAIAQTYCHYGN